MKSTKQLFLPLAILLTLSACKKESSPKTPFTETTYTTLGTYDSKGKPVGLLHDDISGDLSTFITTTLPEGTNATVSHPELFASTAIADVAITQTSDVYVTFVRQGGIMNNSVAFYTYPTSQPPASAKEIKNIIYFFPNASGGLSTLAPGDKVKIGKFDPGTSIGFVLMQNAWDTTKSTLNNDAVHFCTNDVLNPETDASKKKHAVIINYAPESKVLIGFEDWIRISPDCDNDFNDVVFYCTIGTP